MIVMTSDSALVREVWRQEGAKLFGQRVESFRLAEQVPQPAGSVAFGFE